MSDAGQHTLSRRRAFGESFEFEGQRYVVVFEVTRGAVLAVKGEERNPARIYLVTLPQSETVEEQTKKPDQTVRLWTSGSGPENPGPGGWAYVRQEPDGVISVASGGDENTTMMRMKIRAVIEALNALPQRDVPLVAQTDSKPMAKIMTEEEPPSADHDLWDELRRAANGLTITWVVPEVGRVLPDPERCSRLAEVVSAQQAKSRGRNSES